MMRKTIIALFALAAVGLVQPTVASARGGGGHGGGGGGFHGGGFGGGGFRGVGFHGGFAGGGLHGGFHRRAFVGFGLGPTTTDTIPTPTTIPTMAMAAATWCGGAFIPGMAGVSDLSRCAADPGLRRLEEDDLVW
jgi:hypothetical protein